MKSRLAKYIYATCFPLAWILNAGMLVSDFQGGDADREFARKRLRHDIGGAVYIGGLAAVVWPVGVPLILCLTGFAEHGVWNWESTTKPMPRHVALPSNEPPTENGFRNVAIGNTYIGYQATPERKK